MTRGGSWFPGTQKRYNVANIITNVILHSQQQHSIVGGKGRTHMRYLQLRRPSTTVINKEYSAACIRDAQQSRDFSYNPIILLCITEV